MQDTLKRLTDPSYPLSIEQNRDYRSVRSAVYFLRLLGKKPSYRIVAALFQAAGDGMRSEKIRAFLKRLDAVESLTYQGGTQPGRTSDAFPEKSGRDFEHDGTQNDEEDGRGKGRKNRVSSLSGNINENVGTTTAKKTPTEEERRILEICYDWSRGVSTSMPQSLVDLYRNMRPIYNLPSRPGT